MLIRTVWVFLFSLLFFCSRFIESNIKHMCSNDTLYYSNSSSGRLYKTNLDILLSALTSNASRPDGFYSYTAGDTSSGNAVYGLFLCRGDIQGSDCQDCAKTASSEVLQFCPDLKVATIWFDNCMLRYSNQSIISKVDSETGFIVINPFNVTSNRKSFDNVLRDTFDQVMSQAADDDVFSKKFAVQENDVLTKKFAVGQNNVSSKKITVEKNNVPASPRIYALGQCTPDLSSSDCKTCLVSAVSKLPGYPRGVRVLLPSCNIRYEMYMFYQVSAPPPPVFPPPPLPQGIRKGAPPDSGNKQTSVCGAIAIGFSAHSVIVILIICFAIWKRRLIKRRNTKRRAESDENDIAIDPESLQYDLSEIERATNNFSADNKIGKGGFGSVYKGKLLSGQEIAVKRLSKSSGQGAAEFKNEIAVVAKLQHRNLVKLLGFCLEGEEKILVYEFVPRRSLDYFLFDPKKQGLLNWSRRRNIIGGIAKGLLYLHEDSRLTIVHRDLKASNILLDANMNPKIADFGLAKICGVHESEGNTVRIAGTFGYMAPEYSLRGQYSAKSDVFSFGVVVLEVITGKKNSSFYEAENSEDLISHVWQQWRSGTPLALLDPTIGESYVKTEVIQCVQIGLLCVEEDANKRPTMASVVHMLNTTSVSLPTPHNPVVCKDYGSKSLILELGSVDEASFTELHPR